MTLTQRLRLRWRRFSPLGERLLALDEGAFLVLAERDGDEFLLHRLEPPSDVVFRLAPHDGSPVPLGEDVDDVLRRPERSA